MAPRDMTARWGIIAIALILVWRIIQVNVVSYDESGRPRLVAAPAAIDLPPRDRKAFEMEALRGILDANPAEVAALLMLARGFETDGDASRATRAYRAALEVAPLDRNVLELAAMHFLRQEDAGGVELLARLVANYPGTRGQVFPVFAQLLATGSQRAAVAAVIARNPAWLGAFLVDACVRGVDPGILVPALVRRRAPAGSIPPEADCAIERLRRAGRWEEAYLVWLNLQPPDKLASVGHVFNGGFESPPSGGGFDWIPQPRPEKETGHVAEIVKPPGGAQAKALRVVYNGKRQFGTPIRQYLALAPGEYELSGLARPEGIKALKGVHWTVRCVTQGSPGKIIASSERFLGSSEWRRFATALDIGSDCSGQLLQLEPVAEDGAVAFVAGVAWFDDLAISRLARAPASRSTRKVP